MTMSIELKMLARPGTSALAAWKHRMFQWAHQKTYEQLHAEQMSDDERSWANSGRLGWSPFQGLQTSEKTCFVYSLSKLEHLATVTGNGAFLYSKMSGLVNVVFERIVLEWAEG